METHACPIPAYTYPRAGESAALPGWSAGSRDGAPPAGSSFWYNIGFGFGLAFSLDPKNPAPEAVR